MIDVPSPPEAPRAPTRRLTIPKAHSLRSSGSVQQILSAMLPQRRIRYYSLGGKIARDEIYAKNSR